MIDNRKQLMSRPLKRTTIWLVVQCLVILTLVTLPLTFIATTNAKYTAMASSTRTGKVAKWDVSVDVKNLPATKKTITPIPADAVNAGHPLVMFFEGKTGNTGWEKKDITFPITLINDSQVSARFTPDIEVAAPSTALIKPFVTYDIGTSGVVLHPGQTKDVLVTIKSCTFTDLTFWTIVEQAD